MSDTPTTAPPQLHIPEEPVARRPGWYEAVLAGRPIDEVVGGPDGVARWLWSRWRVLAATSVTEEAFVALVLDYRREVWLWLAGERTWAQCCSGLAGRIGRRRDH